MCDSKTLAPVRIGLLEDDTILIESLAELISGSNDLILIKVWENPDAAYQDLIIEQLVNEFDILLVDLMLPLPTNKNIMLNPRVNSVSTGFYFYRFLKRKLKDHTPPVIFFTGALNGNQALSLSVDKYAEENSNVKVLRKPQIFEVIVAEILGLVNLQKRLNT